MSSNSKRYCEASLLDLTFSEASEASEPCLQEPEESQVLETVTDKNTMQLQIDELFKLYKLRNISQFVVKFEAFLNANDRHTLSHNVILRNKIRELTKIFTKSIRNDKVIWQVDLISS